MENILNNDNYICVAVSKTKPVEEINKVYNLGHRDFGENKVQELIKKQKELPKDINWHMIGHLQTNKVKGILPVSYLIHSVDRIKLLNVIDKESKKIKELTKVISKNGYKFPLIDYKQKNENNNRFELIFWKSLIRNLMVNGFLLKKIE